MPIKLVIFDCDGVLFHSERANIEFYNAVLRAVGEPELNEDGEADCHALASAQLFELRYGDRPELLAAIRATAKGMDYTPFYNFMTPRSGLREILGDLRRNYSVAMATNRGKTARDVLRHFDLTEFFDLAVGVLDVKNPKPEPDLLVRCVEHFGVRPAEAVYVGDQSIDQEAADSAACHFVGIGAIAKSAPVQIRELSALPEVIHGIKTTSVA